MNGGREFSNSQLHTPTSKIWKLPLSQELNKLKIFPNYIKRRKDRLLINKLQYIYKQMKHKKNLATSKT
jgi:hypothetical protein